MAKLAKNIAKCVQRFIDVGLILAFTVHMPTDIDLRALGEQGSEPGRHRAPSVESRCPTARAQVGRSRPS